MSSIVVTTAIGAAVSSIVKPEVQFKPDQPQIILESGTNLNATAELPEGAQASLKTTHDQFPLPVNLTAEVNVSPSPVQPQVTNAPANTQQNQPVATTTPAARTPAIGGPDNSQSPQATPTPTPATAVTPTTSAGSTPTPTTVSATNTNQNSQTRGQQTSNQTNQEPSLLSVDLGSGISLNLGLGI